MEIDLRIVASEPIEMEKKIIVNELSTILNHYLKDSMYGKKVRKFSIGVILFAKREGCEDWYTPKKPKYIDFKVLNQLSNDDPIEITNTFRFEFRFEDEILGKYLEATVEDCRKILGSEIIKSLTLLNRLPARANPFNLARFILDLERLLKVEGFL